MAQKERGKLELYPGYKTRLKHNTTNTTTPSHITAQLWSLLLPSSPPAITDPIVIALDPM